jgi:serine-type D-Ala-D-Ala carboxypeptidase/endopeptidase
VVGKYDYGQGRAILTVTREGNRLFAQMVDQPKFEIFPQSPTEYFWKVINAQVTFVKDDKGKVIKAIHRQAGRTIEAPKIE